MRATEPKLFELHPKSVIRIYKEISQLVDLDIEKLKDKKALLRIINDKSFNIEEKYFIVTYLPKYLNFNNPNSLLQRKIKEYEDLGVMEDSQDAVDKISQYAFELNDVCKTHHKILKRTYNTYVNSKINHIEIDEKLINDIKDWGKLPVEKKFRKELENFIINELTPYCDKEVVLEIIKNSFKINAIDENVKLLKVEFDRSADIYNAFNNIYKEYKKHSETLKNASSENNEMLTVNYELPKDVQGDGRKKKTIELKKLEIEKTKRRNSFKDRKERSEYYNATKRINFAKIMFLTFSKVRDNYNKKRDNVTLEQYLKSVAKNI